MCWGHIITLKSMMNIVSRVLDKPLAKLAVKADINKISAVGFVSTLATNVTTFEMLNSMDGRGAMLNSVFAVSAAFTFAGHLAFTMAFDIGYIPYMILGKLIAGVCCCYSYTDLQKNIRIKKPSPLW